MSSQPIDAGKVRAALREALKSALASTDQTMLFRSGKLPGLFPARTAVALAAAETAINEQLLEVVRREEKGKLVFEWVRLAPAGVEYLHRHESPRAVLGELRDALAVSRAGIPVWLEEMKAELTAIGTRLASEVEATTRRLDALATRVDDALRRADAAGPGWPEAATNGVSWSLTALAYLDKRRSSGPAGDCPLPELYSAVRSRDSELTLARFHDGLRRLAEFKAIRLLPFTGAAGSIPEPEYALPSGAQFLYFAAR